MTPYPPLREILPHGPEMLLLDELREADERGLVCALTLRASSTFVRDGSVPCLVAIEYMAQTVAAHFGLRAHRRGHTARSGFLIGVREANFEVDELRVGDALEVRAAVVVEDELRGSFACSVVREGVVMATATLSVYRGPIEAMERPE